MATWNDDQVLYFVALVQQFPALWDSSRNEYNDTFKKRALWNNIVEEMNAKYPENGPYDAGKFSLLQSSLYLFTSSHLCLSPFCLINFSC